MVFKSVRTRELSIIKAEGLLSLIVMEYSQVRSDPYLRVDSDKCLEMLDFGIKVNLYFKIPYNSSYGLFVKV